MDIEPLHEGEYRLFTPANNWESAVFAVSITLSRPRRFSYEAEGQRAPRLKQEV